MISKHLFISQIRSGWFTDIEILSQCNSWEILLLNIVCAMYFTSWVKGLNICSVLNLAENLGQVPCSLYWLFFFFKKYILLMNCLLCSLMFYCKLLLRCFSQSFTSHKELPKKTLLGIFYWRVMYTSAEDNKMNLSAGENYQLSWHTEQFIKGNFNYHF